MGESYGRASFFCELLLIKFRGDASYDLRYALAAMAVRLLSGSARRSLNLRFAVKGIHRAFVREQRLSHGDIWSINRSWITPGPAPRVRSRYVYSSLVPSLSAPVFTSLAVRKRYCKRRKSWSGERLCL